MILQFPFRPLKRTVIYVSLSLLTIVTTGCDDKKQETTKKSTTTTSDKIVLKQSFKDKMAYKDSDEYKLMENTCLYCHKIGTSEEKEIAPKMQIIRDVYKKSFPSKEAFVNAFVKFTVSPAKENSIMPGSVEQYGLMEDSGITKDDVEDIAAYLYDFKF